MNAQGVHPLVSNRQLLLMRGGGDESTASVQAAGGAHGGGHQLGPPHVAQHAQQHYDAQVRCASSFNTCGLYADPFALLVWCSAVLRMSV